MATINDLSTLAVADITTSDYVPVYDASTATDKKTPLYETGSWIPALTFSGGNTGITYASRSGVYRRIADLVYFTCEFTLSSKGSSSGNASISGFPYNASASVWICPIRWENMTSSMDTMVGYLTGSALLILGTTAASTSVSSAAATDFSNSSQLHITGFYIVG